MDLSTAISLIEHPLSKQQTVWADLGCGDGLFTDALSQLLIDGSLIYAVDKNKRALKNVSIREAIRLEKLALDIVADELPFTNLSGILMANSFHFVKDKNTFINKLSKCINKEGYFIIVEYDTDRSNVWVPYPVSYNKLEVLFFEYNFLTKRLHQTASRYNGIIYSALITQR